MKQNAGYIIQQCAKIKTEMNVEIPSLHPAKYLHSFQNMLSVVTTARIKKRITKIHEHHLYEYISSYVLSSRS